MKETCSFNVFEVVVSFKYALQNQKTCIYPNWKELIEEHAEVGPRAGFSEFMSFML